MVQKIGKYFLNTGKITESQLVEALEIQRTKKHFLGEILVEEGMIEETDLLIYLSNLYNVQYITSKKLERMSISELIDDVIPKRIAELHNVFPLKYNPEEGKLTLLTYSPQNIPLFNELKRLLTNVRSIIPVVAYSKAIKALIMKQYSGDLNAFERILRKKPEFQNISLAATITGNSRFLDKSTLSQEVTAVKSINDLRRSDITNTAKVSFTEIINQGEILNRDRASNSVSANMLRSSVGDGLYPMNNEFIELLRVFSAMLDSWREREFHGHTQRVAVLSQRIGKYLSLPETELNDLLIASYLHDAGKRNHISALDIKERVRTDRIIKYATAPAAIFANIQLSKLTISYLTNMYETWNGQGFPHNLRENEIPIGSLILLLCDTFDFLSAVKGMTYSAAFNKIKSLGFFPENLLAALKEVNSIDDVSTQPEIEIITGLIITDNRNLMVEIESALSSMKVKTFSAEIIENAAIILKEHHLIINFVICDSDIKTTQVTPLQLLSAIRKKSAFAELKFYLISKNNINEEIKTKAQMLHADKIIENFSVSVDIQDILRDIEND